MRKMNRFNLLFCLLTYLLVSTEAALTGEGIVGGKEASPNEFTYQISLQRGGTHFCGGAIIGDYHVLTAAHCVADPRGYFSSTFKKVVAGVFDLADQGLGAVTVDVEKVYIPREFGLSGSVGDIAVLKLRQPLGLYFNRQLSKVELPDATNSFAGVQATVTGHGWTWINAYKDPWTGKVTESGGGNDSFKKKFAIADVLTNTDCQHQYTWKHISEKQICARVLQRYYDMAEGICNADSGGPLVYGNVVIGVVSTSPKGCDESVTPAIYTRVSSYLDFIQNALADRVTSNMRFYDLLQLQPQFDEI